MYGKSHAGAYAFCMSLLILLLAAGSCTVRYVADYDEEVKDEILSISKHIDRFYVQLLNTIEEARTFASVKQQYLDIEVELRGLITRNKIRSKNEESVRQSEIALELWLDDKKTHQESNTVSDFIINQHRDQFQRIFIAMAKGEEAKKQP